MKKILYFALSLIQIFGATSCEKWLDVNTNPDKPNNESASVEIRLPWIQHYYMYAYGSAGGGVVGVKINGKKEILAIDIKPEIVDPDDIETLSDILVAAVNEAIKRVEDTNSAEMGKITGNIGMPGLF